MSTAVETAPPETEVFTLAAVPVLHVEAKGEVITNNVAEFREFIRTAISAINREPKTEEEFGQAMQDVQGLKNAEETIKAAKAKALADAESLQSLFATLDETTNEISQARLELEKLIAQRKEQVKAELVAEYLAKYTVDADLAERHLRPRLQEAIKGKRTLESMKKALDVEQKTKQALIDRCRGILDTFANGHGPDLIMDRRELELKRPDEGEAELRRRFEAKKTADENRVLREQAAAAKTELEAKRDAQPDPLGAAIGQDAPVKTVKIYGHGAPESFPPVNGDQEWATFVEGCKAVFAALKPVRAALRDPQNVARAQRFADGVNAAWKEVTA